MKNILKCLIFYTVFINSQFFCFGRAEFSSKSTKLMQNKINVYYQKAFSHGDPIFVVAKISRDKKDGNSQNITKIKIHLFQKQDDNEEKKIESSELYCINAGFPQKKADLFIGGLPASSFLKNGKYYIKPEFFTDKSNEFQKEKKLILPIKLIEKKFVEEVIPLNQKNTAIKTDTSRKRTVQINTLNKILETSDEKSIFETNGFQYPSSATRRTSFFADRRTYRYVNGKTSTSLHYGIDWGTPEGTEIFACGRGKVALAEFRNSTGWSICIEHFPGLYSLYYHLSSLKVKEGDFVEKGDFIGFSGSTGLATGPHIPWEIRLNSKAVNPDWFVENIP